MQIEVKRLPHNLDLPLPSYETEGSAGMDVRAAVPAGERLALAPGKRLAVPTGLTLAIPPGYMVQVCSRSGMALRNGVVALIAPGIIDSDYRGELIIILINHDDDRYFNVERGDRIAQLIVLPVFRAEWEEAKELTTTERGTGGFGSTGR